MNINLLVSQFEEHSEDFLTDLLSIKSSLEQTVKSYLTTIKVSVKEMPNKEEFLNAFGTYIFAKIDKEKLKSEILSKLPWNYKIVSFIASKGIDIALPIVVSYAIAKADTLLMEKASKTWYDDIKKTVEGI